MIIDFQNYKLIDKDEDLELFQFQKDLLEDNLLPLNEKAVRLAILLVQAPICDYETAVNLLYDFSIQERQLPILILGAFFNALWPFIQPNPFIPWLIDLYDECDLDKKSIIKYIMAIDIDNKRYGNNTDINVVKSLLEESIFLSKKYVYNYYRLALVSERQKAKKLLEQALFNIQKVYDDTQTKKIKDYFSFASYLQEHIVGTTLSKLNYDAMERIYKKYEDEDKRKGLCKKRKSN